MEHEVFGDLNGQARLAGARRARQGQQANAGVAQQVADSGALGGAPDQRRALGGQAARATGHRCDRGPRADRCTRSGRQSHELGLDVGRARPDRGRLLEHREEQPLERGGHVGHQAAGTRCLRRSDGVEHRQRRRGFERVHGRRQLVEHHTEREHVAGAGHRVATGLLWRHVARRAEHHGWIGGIGAGRGRPGDGGRRRQPGEPEIEDLHVAVLAQHDVLGLDVAMDDAGGVGHRQRARQLPSEPGQRAGVDGCADQRGQRSPFHELHGQEAAIAQIADGVDRDDVGVIERRRGPRLVLEAPHRVGVARERGPEQLERDLAAELGILGQVDLTHTAAADERDHVVGADTSAQRRGLLLPRQPLGGHVHRRRGDEVTRSRVRDEQRFDFPPHVLVGAARLAQKRRALFGRQRQRRVEQLSDPLVLLGSHRCGPSSRKSHAWARLQSRRTVPTDISSTCAVSSRLMPPKKRSSMTRHCRAFRPSSVFKASSSATRSTPGVVASTSRGFRQRDVEEAAAALRAVPRPGHVHEHAPHHLRRRREEVGAALPAHVLPVDQPEIRLVDERCRLEEVSRALARHEAHREAVQLVEHQGGQRLEGGLVTLVPRDEQLRDARRGTHRRRSCPVFRFPPPLFTEVENPIVHQAHVAALRWTGRRSMPYRRGCGRKRLTGRWGFRTGSTSSAGRRGAELVVEPRFGECPVAFQRRE